LVLINTVRGKEVIFESCHNLWRDASQVLYSETKDVSVEWTLKFSPAKYQDYGISEQGDGY
jgi:hypothetical protein